MVHRKRHFSVAKVGTAEELANKLTQWTWCCCNGFQLGDLIFVNDSFSENGAQEYNVFHEGKSIESITFGWCSEEKGLEIIKDLQKQVEEKSFTTYSDISEVVIQSPKEHGRCHLCA